MSFHVPEAHRITDGPLASDVRHGNNGAFFVRAPSRSKLWIIASDGAGWEHVSVHVDAERRCPTWEEMCFVKGLFWDPEDCVLQFHPPKSEYVNCHPFTLHLWKSTCFEMVVPDPLLVGPREAAP